ncbi:MAG: hypothetical protein R3B94_09190 [Hyphomonas sp.]
MSEEIKIVHEGRAGYVELEGYQYTIDHVEAGCFCIHFPSGNRHKDLQDHFDRLTAFAETRDPKWYVGGNTKRFNASKS